MQSFSGPEIDEVLASLGICLGKSLQTAVVGESDVVLGFWEGRRTIWLWMDLNMQRPTLLPMVELPGAPANKRSPLQLFLKAHFIGRKLTHIERVLELGRVVHLTFDDGGRLEFRMIPRGMNLIASSGGKQVSFRPVQSLPPAAETLETSSPRSLRDLFEQWRASRFSEKARRTPREAVEKKIESLQKSLRKVEGEIEKKAHSPWRRFGQWLVENQSMNVPPEFLALVDRRRKLAWNVEEAFRKAKEAERKLEGTRARAIELKVQIADLEKRLSQGDWLSVEKKKTSPKGDRPDARTLRLSETLHVVAGKSARDNLDLLRKAHAWDLWLHVKDQPSAHAIVFRPKGAKLSDEQLRQASQWLIKMSLGSKYKAHVGEKFEILAAECRFVTPIKGDRLGRVTYRNEKVFILKFEGERPPSP